MLSEDDSIQSGVIQKAGFLYKLPFRRQQGKWQQRFFILKDSYMLYYGKKKKSTTRFDVHPKGVIPLGNATVEYYDAPSSPPLGYFTFRVTHPDFGSGAMVLACKGKVARDEWISVISDCSRITYENALLGDTMISKLQAKGSELEKENEAAVKRMEEEALKLRLEKENHVKALTRANESALELQVQNDTLSKEQEEQQRLLHEKNAADAAKKSALDLQSQIEASNKAAAEEAERLKAEQEEMVAAAEEVSLQASLLEEQKSLAEMMLKETAEQAARREASAQAKLELMGKSKEEVEQKLDLERKRRKKAERKLKAAEDSLVRLNAVLIRSDSKLADDVKQDVNKLKSFFEARTNEIREEAALTETLKHALSAKKSYHRSTSQQDF